jgi:penicillin-binding protein A
MNRPMRKVSIALAVLFLALFVNLNVVQVFKGDSYRDDTNNRRVLLNEYSNPRGQVVVQGHNIAESVATRDELKYLRRYPSGPVYAPATGYYSYVYGTSGVEEKENEVLSGDSPKLFTTKLAGLLTGRNPRGGSVDLTLSQAAQEAGYKAMRNPDGTYKRGAIVALDPKTGGILAMVSTPSYDPNQLASHNSQTITQAWACYQPLTLPDQRTGESVSSYRARYNKSVRAQIAKRRTDCKNVPDDPTAQFAADPQMDSPMLNRALNQTYPPGSIFKIIDSAAALKKGILPSTSVPAPNAYWPLEPTRTSRCPANLAAACIENFQGEACQNGKTATLRFALAKSCNTAFAALAVDKLGAQSLAAQAGLFGLDGPAPEVPMQAAPSTIGSEGELARDKAALAQTSFGQRSARMTPLQAAMLSSAVANYGTLMKPYLIKDERRPNLSVLDTVQPEQQSQVLDPTLDKSLVDMMEHVVTGPEGTGGPANITQFGPSVVVGGKTGTADVGATSASKVAPDAWFTGFALVQGSPRIAVAVVIENGGVQGNEATGGLAAGPVAKKVMTAYLKSVGVS